MLEFDDWSDQGLLYGFMVVAHATLASLSSLKQTSLEMGEGELQVYIASPIIEVIQL